MSSSSIDLEVAVSNDLAELKRQVRDVLADDPSRSGDVRFVPRDPRTLEDTGLKAIEVETLVLKFLLHTGHRMVDRYPSISSCDSA